MSGPLVDPVAGILLLCALTACASAPPPESASRGPICEDGPPILTVRSDLVGEIEVVEARSRSGARNVIAILGPGTHQLEVRNDPAYYYYARSITGGRTLATTGRRRPSNAVVMLERSCRATDDADV